MDLDQGDTDLCSFLPRSYDMRSLNLCHITIKLHDLCNTTKLILTQTMSLAESNQVGVSSCLNFEIMPRQEEERPLT